MKIGAKTGCHQLHERSFFFKGSQFPVCARCTGIFTGQLLGLSTFFLYFDLNIFYLFIPAVFFVLLLAIDGIGQLKKKWVSTNPRRFFTGITSGYFAMVLIANLIKKIISMIK